MDIINNYDTPDIVDVSYYILFINISDTTVKRVMLEDSVNGAEDTDFGWNTTFVALWVTAKIALGEKMN